MQLMQKLLLSLPLLLLTACVSAQSLNCQTSNPALEAMPPVLVTITRADGSRHELTAKLADNNVTRAAGFQRVCASTMKEVSILFVFEQEVLPSFHMNNVLAPIDIAFIRSSSEIDVIHKMKPYSLVVLEKPLYSPKRPVIAALETYDGFFTDHNVDGSSTITWQAPKETDQ